MVLFKTNILTVLQERNLNNIYLFLLLTWSFYKSDKNTESSGKLNDKHNIGNFLQLSTLMAEDTTQTCAMSSYSYVLFKNVSVSLKPETLYWEKHIDLSFHSLVMTRERMDIINDYGLIAPKYRNYWKESILAVPVLKTVEWGQGRERNLDGAFQAVFLKCHTSG